jgi:DHA3 family tetracycline resistance protein-like MFS transporter
MKTARLTLNAYTAYLILIGTWSVLRGLIYTVVAVYYLSIVRMNPLQLVLVGTVLEATVLVFEVPTGVFADAFSRRTAVVLGQILFGVAFVLEGMVPLVAMILVAEAIRGIGESFNSGALQALVAGEVGEAHLGLVFLRGAQVSRLGFLVGIAGSVGLASIRLNLPIIIGGVLSIGLGLFVLMAMPERGFQPPSRGRRTSWELMYSTVREGVRLAWERPVLRMFIGLAASLGLASEGLDRLWEAHLLTNFVFPSLGRFKPVVWFGIIEAGSLILGIGVIDLLRRRVNMQHHPALASVLFALTALRMAATWTFALTRQFSLALIAYWSVSVARGVGGIFYTTWLTREVDPRVRATVLSIVGQADAFGQIAGGPVIGAIGTARSLRAALVTAGAVLGPALLFFKRFRGRERVLPPEHEATNSPSALTML